RSQKGRECSPLNWAYGFGSGMTRGPFARLDGGGRRGRKRPAQRIEGAAGVVRQGGEVGIDIGWSGVHGRRHTSAKTRPAEDETVDAAVANCGIDRSYLLRCDVDVRIGAEALSGDG